MLEIRKVVLRVRIVLAVLYKQRIYLQSFQVKT